MISIFKIKFNKSAYDLNDEYEQLSEHEQERISNLDAEAFFDYDDIDDCYVCYVMASPLDIEKYLEVLEKNFIDHKCSNISKDVLSHKVDLTEELRDVLNPLNSIKWSFFIDDVDEWIKNNLDIDTILDRISELGGLDKLSKVEKEFLRNYQS
jgi:hypothetical protein